MRFAALLLFLVLMSPAPPSTPAAPEPLVRALTSVVRVHTSNGAGSGVFVTPEHILTAKHLLADCEGEITVDVFVYDAASSDFSGFTAVPATVFITAKPDSDWAILKLSASFPSASILPPAPRSLLRRGAPLLRVGCAMSLDPLHTRGELTDPSARSPDGSACIIATLPTFFGDSGGPVFVVDGDQLYLVGIASAIAVCPQGTGPHLCFIIPLPSHE